METEVTIGHVGDTVVQFRVWVKLCQVGSLLINEKNEVRSAVEFQIGNCHIVLFPIQDMILGDKCKFGGTVSWQPLGSDATDASDKMRLVRFFTELPSTDFMSALGTIDQLFEWINLKNNCIDIAKCWLAGREFPDNPMSVYLMEGTTAGKAYHDYIWLSADLFENLYKLAEQRHQKIKSAFIKQGWGYPFNTPRNFIEEMLALYINSEFAPYLKPWHDIKARNFRELVELARKSIKGIITAEEQQKRDLFVKKYSQQNVWLNRLLDASEILAKRDSFIKARLDVHQSLLIGITAIMQDACRKPNLKSIGMQDSFNYTNGFKKLIKNNKKGEGLAPNVFLS